MNNEWPKTVYVVMILWNAEIIIVTPYRRKALMKMQQLSERSAMLEYKMHENNEWDFIKKIDTTNPYD